jgi:ribosomal protein S18 acetylase RimI-like enzyme
MEYKFYTNKKIEFESYLHLYQDAEWVAYTNDLLKLKKAINNSMYILTVWHNNLLVGLLRAIGDKETVVYIQDIIILKSYQRQQLGSKLLPKMLKKYKHVRQIFLTTDNLISSINFYEKNGFVKLHNQSLQGFARINLM